MADKALILKFKDRLLADKISSGRVLKYVYTLKALSAMLPKPFMKCDKDDIIALIAKINASDYKENTKCDFKKILKRFYRWTNGDEIYPENIRWLKKIGDGEDKFHAGDILTPEEVKAIANNMMPNQMLKAFVLTLFASGARIGEILPAKIKQFIFDDKGVIFNITEGKTGARRVRIDAPFYSHEINELLIWLNAHTDKNNSEAYVWTMNSGKAYMAYHTALYCLRVAGKKAGITKPVNPHSFRHASVTFDIGLPPEVLKTKYGWKTNEMIATYAKLSGEKVDEEILRYRRIDTNKTDLMTKVCVKCKHNNGLSEHICTECNFPLDYEGSVKVDEIDRVKTEAVYRFIMRQVEKNAEAEQDWLNILDELKIKHLWDKEGGNSGKK